MPIEKFCLQCSKGREHQCKDIIFNDVKNAAYKIIEGKGATYYAIGLAVRRIVEAILRDENSVLSVSSLMEGYYGVRDVCLSLPTIVNEKGIAKVLELPLNDEEIKGFRHSAKTLKELLKEVGF